MHHHVLIVKLETPPWLPPQPVLPALRVFSAMFLDLLIASPVVEGSFPMLLPNPSAMTVQSGPLETLLLFHPAMCVRQATLEIVLDSLLVISVVQAAFRTALVRLHAIFVVQEAFKALQDKLNVRIVAITKYHLKEQLYALLAYQENTRNQEKTVFRVIQDCMVMGLHVILAQQEVSTMPVAYHPVLAVLGEDTQLPVPLLALFVSLGSFPQLDL